MIKMARIYNTRIQYTCAIVVVSCYIFMMCCCCAASGAFVSADSVSGEDNDSLRDQVTLLSKQVSALLDRRREDFEMMEDSMRKTLAKSREIVAVKEELEELRDQVNQLRSNRINNDGSSESNPHYHHRSAAHVDHESNDRLTLRWLSDTVTEIKGELAEAHEAQTNASSLASRRVDAELRLLRADVTGISRALEGARTDQLKHESTLGELLEEVTAVRDSERATAGLCSNINNQLKATQQEWSYNWKTVMASRKAISDETKTIKDTSSNLESSADTHKSRHQRILRKHILDLQRQNEKLTKSQKELEERVRFLEQRMQTKGDKNTNYNKRFAMKYRTFDDRFRIIENRIDKVETSINSGGSLHPSLIKTRPNHDSYGNTPEHSFDHRSNIQDNNIDDTTSDDINMRIDKLEAEQKETASSMFNMSIQVSSFDQLHRSILELLENVENLESRVDKNVPDFKKEISKLEFDMAQALSEVALVREDQTNLDRSTKSLSTGVAALRSIVANDHETLEQVNITLALMQESINIQNTKIHDHILKTESSHLPESYGSTNSTNIVQELEEVENEYKSIINKLPHDCGSVTGPAGLYLISPGAGEPVMTTCDNGWTTIQRRRDGTVDFNRNWDEYSRGFGSASGEFWIGNHVLNRLTKNNCSQLRIDMLDIYGKSYHADYSEFVVENMSNGYRLHVSGYSGNSSDALDYQNRMEFSTIDSDRDISNTHCASNYEGGWWFSHCQHANLNGRYNLGLTWFDSARNEWIAVATSEMKIKRKEECRTHDIERSDLV